MSAPSGDVRSYAQASPNRPAYGPDGDYFTKPNRETVVEAVYRVMRERRPEKYAPLD